MTTLPQRRMSDARERELVLRQLEDAGLDPKDERAGYLHAVCAILAAGSLTMPAVLPGAVLLSF